MSVSLWALVIVFVVLGLALMLMVVSVVSGMKNLRGPLIGGLFGVVLGWAAFYAGVTLTGQQIEMTVAGFEGETVQVPGGENPEGAAQPAGGGGAKCFARGLDSERLARTRAHSSPSHPRILAGHV